jgi:serine-type D-Ala-D-Ala endopeptidase (penicillin-binding protein 7)
VGQITGLHATEDPLALRSSVALVVDQQTDEVLFSKNPDAVLPIASITKLMTALVVVDAGLSLDEPLEVSQDDVRGTAGSNLRSKLRPGTRLSRGELMHLSLMSSENRAAHALGRTYPGGLGAFVRAMNLKAAELGMADTRYVEPTGLSADNRSSATDLARLVRAAAEHPVIRSLSTSLEAVLPVGPKPQPVQFRNTNGLVHNPEWGIGLQKTGFISAAGRCVVMQAELAGRQLIMVLLDSAGRYSRIGDAERLRKWLSEQTVLPLFGRRSAPLPATATPQPPLPTDQPPALQPALQPVLGALPTVPAAAPWAPVPAAPGVPLIDPAKPWVQVPALPLAVPRPAAEAAAQPR